MSRKNPTLPVEQSSDAVCEIERITHPSMLHPPFIDILAGMAAGGIAGAMAGPPGLIAGMVLGSAVGAAAGLTAEMDERRHSAEDDQLDRDIGVVGGQIGEALPD